MARIARWTAVGLALAAAAACAKAQARTPAAVPVLETPAPPPRLVVPVAVEPPPAPPVVAAPERPPAASPVRPRETPPRTTPPPATTPPPTTEPPTPPVLQTLPNPAELEARARERLDRAEKDLTRVSRASLSREARDQYDSAVRFIRMGRDAIAVKNFVYAVSCADKAAALAELLVKLDEPLAAGPEGPAHTSGGT